MSAPPRRLEEIVAIPARDEAALIGPCLDALLHGVERAPAHILVLVNASTDATATLARRSRPPPGTRIHVVERALPPGGASAGRARRLAMDLAADLVGPAGALLTTDADARVAPDWLARNLDLLEADAADLVAGRVELDPDDWAAIPIHLHADDALECAYDALCDEIDHRLDPRPDDPWPRHTQEAGASLAMTVAAYRRCGGLPPVASGEDRALAGRMREVDARIRHAPGIRVHVSGRLVGRAAGGMAETIARRIHAPDAHLDPRLEPVRSVVRRATCRRLARAGFGDAAPPDPALAQALHLEPHRVARLLASRHFGAAWSALERESPALVRHAVPVARLEAELAAARAVLGRAAETAPAFRDLGPDPRVGRPAASPAP